MTPAPEPPLSHDAAVIDAARTALHWQRTGADPAAVARDLGCEPDWVAIEMSVRWRLLADPRVMRRAA